MSRKIQGVLSAVVTPFDTRGALAPEALRRQISRQVEAGNGVFCAGTNGEFFVLETAEKIRVAEISREATAGKVPLVAHIGEVSPAATIALGREMARIGVDAVSVVTPWFVALKQNELIDHYTRIADALTVPVYLYNIPPRAGNTIEPATAAALARHPNIIGLKDSAGSWQSITAFLDATREAGDFDILCGPDHLAHDGLLAGCAGCISGLSNVAPQWVSRIWTRFQAGDIAGSRAAQDVISALRNELYAVAFAPAAVKKALTLMGEDVGESRYATAFGPEQIAALRAVIARHDLTGSPALVAE